MSILSRNKPFRFLNRFFFKFNIRKYEYEIINYILLILNSCLAFISFFNINGIQLEQFIVSKLSMDYNSIISRHIFLATVKIWQNKKNILNSENNLEILCLLMSKYKLEYYPSINYVMIQPTSFYVNRDTTNFNN